MNISTYYSIAQSREQISRDYVRFLGQLVILYFKKDLFDSLASLAFSGAVFNNCTIVLGSQPLAPQVTTAIYSCEVSSPCD